MARWFHCPVSGANIFDGSDDQPTTVDVDGVTLCNEVDEATYNANVAAFEAAQEETSALNQLRLLVTRSTVRANAVELQDNSIDDGRPYAVFIEDQPILNITQIVFDLDEVTHNTEFSAPWDFNTTDVGGEAIKFTFTAGTHEIDAHITYNGGSIITITATFEVD